MKKIVKPWCERNSKPILKVLKKYLKTTTRLLEVGSGNAQHAVYFASSLSHLTWITSELPLHHEQIGLWLKDSPAKNLQGPLSFEIGVNAFPATDIDAIFSANTFHIMPWEVVKKLIKQAGTNLNDDSLFLVYGPFQYNGKFTSKSNEEFHHKLRQNASHQGIREFKDVHAQFLKRGFTLVDDISMPAFNQILIYKK